MADENIYTLNEKIVPTPIEDEMKGSYIDYAMSVIVGRALPDARDGLKPVHRRILFAMNEIGFYYNKPYKKSARIVGEVLGKYHPHGDTAVYDSLVRMVQDFSLRYPLIDGQGNFGSVDGDSAAAMRYTEARLGRFTEELLTDIEKDTVEFTPNFDESLKEPTVLPSRIPHLLVNGSSGIAVGMATNIPPHNLNEICSAMCALIDDPGITTKDLIKHVKGPDFPTGAQILGREGIKSAYETGRGRVQMRAKAFIEKSEKASKKDAIIITEIPYQVNKANLIESIARLVEAKKVEGIYDIRDESDKDGMRIVIELKKEANENVILNQLYKHTQMQDTFGIIMLSLVDGRPKVCSLKEMLEVFIEHRVEVITRRTRFELDKAERRAHILEGLKKAIANLDKIIALIRKAKSPELARESLIKTFKFSPEQAKAILEMQLQRLTALERDKIDDEYKELLKKINYYQALLKSRQKILGVVKDETAEAVEAYGDERRTQIAAAAEDLDIEDLIVEEDVLVTLSHMNYIKRMPVSTYRKQRRGGKGVTGGGVRSEDEDFIERLFLCSTHDYILFFTNTGRVYWKKAYEIPAASRQAKGKAIQNFLALAPNEKIASTLQVKEFNENRNLVMATKEGIIKKTSLSAYSNPRSKGIQAITLKDKDQLIGCAITDGKQEIFLATKQGKAIRFSEKQAREMGRTASGVRGINLAKGDAVIGLEIVNKDASILTVMSKGFGKQTTFDEYRIQSRGGKGIINVKATEKNGEVITVLAVRESDEVIVVTSSAMVVRVPAEQIRSTGRSTQGVRLVALKDKDVVASAAIVVAKEEEEE